jgi:hypothetical protein
MSKENIMEIFAIDELEPCFPIGQVKKFLKAAKRNPLPRGYEYKIIDKPVGSSVDCYDIYLIIAKRSIEDYLDEAYPICYLRQG